MEPYDSYTLVQLAYRTDFDGLKKALYDLCPGTKSCIRVFDRAYHNHDTGGINGIAHDRVLQEVYLRGW